RHFSSKEELAAEAFRFAHAQSLRTRTDDLDPALSPLDRLRTAIARFVESPSVLPGGCPLMNTAIDADDSNTALRELALEAFTGWRRRLAAIVREGIRVGQIRRDAEPRQIANTLVSTLEGALMLSRLEGTRTPMRDAAASLHALLGSLEVSSSAHTAERAARTMKK
ncbi:MAG TPA: TetR family transcriptional regulator C-terminal domain-containing protein, partial [Terracidiphilus sp.]|nr:TetR family transcriptional regulator C-terminal domain-containing protein [Terracidiphilus sp.]